MPRKIQDLQGQTFDRLTVLERGDDYSSGGGKRVPRWRCVCSCGAETIVATANLTKGKTTSCGCKLHESAWNHRHGACQTKIYGTWSSMLNRCRNPTNRAYRRYGGRGIHVCDKWLGPNGFEQFVADMGPKPTPSHTVERVDNDRGYSPENCVWATKKEQARNTCRQCSKR